MALSGVCGPGAAPGRAVAIGGVLTREGMCFPHRAVISPLLANIYLDDFDEAIAATPLKLVHYADDFVVLGRQQQQVAKAQGQVAQLLDGIGLLLHPDKTRLTSFDRGFRFLGHVFSGDLVLPAKKAGGRGQKAEKGVSPNSAWSAARSARWTARRAET